MVLHKPSSVKSLSTLFMALTLITFQTVFTLKNVRSSSAWYAVPNMNEQGEKSYVNAYRDPSGPTIYRAPSRLANHYLLELNLTAKVDTVSSGLFLRDSYRSLKDKICP
ncbi:hypothetical protein AB6A40_011396 [Gnathostoma spinigerum]|uniref:Uncharacterized protein n=1 Tax=Gnathostoma spinigerum TaxID=75299 RepID=A0ABD6EZS9_9BILA